MMLELGWPRLGTAKMQIDRWSTLLIKGLLSPSIPFASIVNHVWPYHLGLIAG